MSIIVNTKTFSRHNQVGTRVEYRGPGHTDLDTDALALQSSDPVRTKTSYGNRRSYLLMARGVSTPRRDDSSTIEQQNMSVKTTFSVPVGCTRAEAIELLTDYKSAFDVTSLVEQLCIDGKIDV